jgi:hypothetical protein
MDLRVGDGIDDAFGNARLAGTSLAGCFTNSLRNAPALRCVGLQRGRDSFPDGIETLEADFR